MFGLLLYVHIENTLLYTLVWIAGIIVFVLLVIALLVQRRTRARLQGELALQEKMRQGYVEYEFILKAMKLCVWHLDPKTRFITHEVDFRERQDHHQVMPNGPIETIVAMMGKSVRERVYSALVDICTGRTSSFYQQYQIRPGNAGPLLWEESYATVVARDAAGLPEKIVGASMYIGDRKNMEAALVNARNKAEESERMKAAFLASIGHEIRTPLNAIVGFADLLHVVEGKEERDQLIAEIQANNQKLIQVVEGLVSMSQIEAEGKTLAYSQVDLNQIITQMVGTYAMMVHSPDVSIETQFPRAELTMVTDLDKLTEILKHMMQNAVKFTAKGKITVGYDYLDEDDVCIWIRDTGKGIPAEEQERIFDRFVKLDDFVPGMGLGLSAAKSYVDSLGGVIGVESRLGEGSTFWVRLPLIMT